MCFVLLPLLYQPPWAGQTAEQIWTCLGVGNYPVCMLGVWFACLDQMVAVDSVKSRWLMDQEISWADRSKGFNEVYVCAFVWVCFYFWLLFMCDNTLSLSLSLGLFLRVMALAHFKLFYPHAAWMDQNLRVLERSNQPQQLLEEIWCQVRHTCSPRDFFPFSSRHFHCTLRTKGTSLYLT